MHDFSVDDWAGMTVLPVVIMLVIAFAGEEACGFLGVSAVVLASQSMVEVAATFFGFGWIAFS